MVRNMSKIRPLFRQGTLIFKESGHPLRISDRHYRCDLDCKRKCHLKEPQIKRDTLDTAFSRLTEGLEIDTITMKAIYKDVMKSYFVDVLFENFDEKDAQQDIIDTSIAAMRADLEVGNPMELEDVPDVQNAFVRIQQLDYPSLLFSYLMGTIAAFSEHRRPAERARNLALITKSIEISKDKKIVGIEFERWGWYILNFVKKYKPDYLKKFSIKVLNTEDEILGLPLNEAMRYFNADNFNEALHNHNASEIYPVFGMMKTMTTALISGDPKEMQAAVVEMMTTLTQLPAAEFSTRIKPLLK